MLLMTTYLLPVNMEDADVLDENGIDFNVANTNTESMVKKPYNPSPLIRQQTRWNYSITTTDRGESDIETSDRNMSGSAGGKSSLHNYAQQGKL